MSILTYGGVFISIPVKASRNVQVLVSYSFFEKDPGQRDNFEYFIMEGIGIHNGCQNIPQGIQFSVVISGDLCSPCSLLTPLLTKTSEVPDGVAAAMSSHQITLLYRTENFGMDIAAHNVSAHASYLLCNFATCCCIALLSSLWKPYKTLALMSLAVIMCKHQPPKSPGY